jgi:hypothetical protein
MLLWLCTCVLAVVRDGPYADGSACRLQTPITNFSFHIRCLPELMTGRLNAGMSPYPGFVMSTTRRLGQPLYLEYGPRQVLCLVPLCSRLSGI